MTYLFDYEQKYLDKGFKFIAGVDEVGLGCIAGPLYAAAVILDLTDTGKLTATVTTRRKPREVLVNDSKQLSLLERELLLQPILNNCLAYGIGIVEVDEINRVKNIMKCGALARERAVRKLATVPDCILVDGPWGLNNINGKIIPIVKGDTLSISIAAASIIAKVHRDRYMRTLHAAFPVYDWANNVGYGTRKHWVGIKAYDICEHHRRHLIKASRRPTNGSN